MNTMIALQVDPLNSLNLKSDTTLRISQEAQKRGAKLFAYTPNQLAYNQGSLSTKGCSLQFDNQGHLIQGETETLNLASVDFVLIRQNPPFDKTYLSNTLLLDHLPTAVRALNNPKGLRIVSEKLFTLGFPDFIPPTLVTTDCQQAIDFINLYKQVILKPLYEYGGKGILTLHDQDPNNQAVLELYADIYPEGFMVQKYLPELKQGDKRIVLINGHPVGAFLRQPQDNQIRSNLRVGGTALRTELTTRDYEICEALAPFLKQWGLYLVGLDVIGNCLTEVNVTSPTGFVTLEELYGINAAAIFWEDLGV